MLIKERQKLINADVNKILPNPAQPRRKFGSEDICALADSIRENGLLQPVIIRRSGSDYILIAGERRLRAAKLAGLREIPAVLTDHTSGDSAALAIIENLQRKDLSVFEEAFAICALIKEWGLTQEEAAKRLGMSQSAVANKLRLLRLTPSEQRFIEEHELSERHARAVIRLEHSEDRKKVLEAIVKKGLNVKNTEELIDRILAPPKRRAIKGSLPGDVRLFINTIDRAVTTMLTAGIKAKAERKETEDYIECIVRIPKRGKAS